MLRRLSAPLPGADAATVSLVLTELVTNAVRHGCGDSGAGIGVDIWRAPGVFRIEVSQSGELPDLGEVRRRRPGLERGYGVLLLDGLCRAWGLDGGRGRTWAEVSLDDHA